MEEKLLQYIWKNRVFPLTDYHLVTGEKLEIVSVGEENLDSGPDFFNAKIKIFKLLAKNPDAFLKNTNIQ